MKIESFMFWCAGRCMQGYHLFARGRHCHEELEDNGPKLVEFIFQASNTDLEIGAFNRNDAALSARIKNPVPVGTSKFPCAAQDPLARRPTRWLGRALVMSRDGGVVSHGYGKVERTLLRSLRLTQKCQDS